MSRVVPILGIIAAALAGIFCIITADLAYLLPAVYALGAGITLCISKDWRRYGPGAAAILFAILGTLGVLNSVQFENGGVDFGISTTLGYACVITASLMVALASALQLLPESEPAWLAYIWIGAAALAAILALSLNGDFGDFGVGLMVASAFAFVSMGGPIQRLVQE